MVVDDNMVNRLVTKRLLDRIGISTRCVDSGKECLRILRRSRTEERYDVLLLDLMMPEVCIWAWPHASAPTLRNGSLVLVPLLYLRTHCRLPVPADGWLHGGG